MWYCQRDSRVIVDQFRPLSRGLGSGFIDSAEIGRYWNSDNYPFAGSKYKYKYNHDSDSDSNTSTRLLSLELMNPISLNVNGDIYNISINCGSDTD